MPASTTFTASSTLHFAVHANLMGLPHQPASSRSADALNCGSHSNSSQRHAAQRASSLLSAGLPAPTKASRVSQTSHALLSAAITVSPGLWLPASRTKVLSLRATLKPNLFTQQSTPAITNTKSHAAIAPLLALSLTLQRKLETLKPENSESQARRMSAADFHTESGRVAVAEQLCLAVINHDLHRVQACIQAIEAWAAREHPQSAEWLTCFIGAPGTYAPLYLVLTNARGSSESGVTDTTLIKIMQALMQCAALAHAKGCLNHQDLLTALSAKSSNSKNQVPGLFAALRDDCAVTIKAYIGQLGVLAAQGHLNSAALITLLEARNSQNRPGLEAARFYNANTAIQAYLDAVLSLVKTNSSALPQLRWPCEFVRSLLSLIKMSSSASHPSDSASLTRIEALHLETLGTTRHYPTPHSYVLKQ